MRSHGSYRSVLTMLGIVCLWLGGISGDLYRTARTRAHRGPSHRVTRQIVSDGEHSQEIEIYQPVRLMTGNSERASNPDAAALVPEALRLTLFDTCNLFAVGQRVVAGRSVPGRFSRGPPAL